MERGGIGRSSAQWRRYVLEASLIAWLQRLAASWLREGTLLGGIEPGVTRMWGTRGARQKVKD